MGGKEAKDSWKRVISELKAQCGINFDDGLIDAEIRNVESRFDFRFPPDLNEFLKIGLPRGDQFPNWRSEDETKLRDWLDVPRQGVLFDIRQGFWLPEWGRRPQGLEDAFKLATDLIRAAPKLIPVYSHRMMPDEPNQIGNPVFSVHQTDIIVYGNDLLSYFRNEFGVALWWNPPSDPRSIRFWDPDRFTEICWNVGYRDHDENRGIVRDSAGQ